MKVETGAGHDDERRADGQQSEESRERRRFDFERGYMVAAFLLLIAAAVLLYLRLPSAAFVAAALGISAWFLNLRDGLKRKHDLVKRGPRNWVPRDRDKD